jgi:ABC-type multidrug transport system fused ATPase/permease subunit
MHLYNPTTDDASLIAALSAFGLWETILAKGGLDAPLAAGEEVLSHGQKQLFCFARSTLQEGNIVLLDEPSSQSDRETGAMMERTIEETFRGRTVLCVAHKLSTVLEFDGVVVMDAGAVVEMGSPRALLDDRGSVFSGLMGSQRGQVEDGLE